MFKDRERGLSYISEIRMMQESFDAMKRFVPAPPPSHRKHKLMHTSRFSSIASFTKFAPVATVRALLEARTEATLGVEDRAATMFFSDIEGFTAIAERVPPHDLMRCLEQYFDAMTATIEGSGGTVGDFIGDAIFAFWGAPNAVGPLHALRAVRAAWQQQQQLHSLRDQWRGRGLPQLRVRMGQFAFVVVVVSLLLIGARPGLNSGSVLAGTVGSSTRLKYTLMGDNVNLAARLEGLGKYYGVYLMLSEGTWHEPRVQEEFVSRAIDTVQVVGKSVPTTVLTVVALRVDATAAQLVLEKLSWQMIALYRAGDFAATAVLLQQMLDIEPGLHSTVKLQLRVQGFLLQPPLEWKGAHTMDSK